MKAEPNKQTKDRISQKPYSNLRTSLSELDECVKLLKQQIHADTVNGIARTRNESIINNEDPLEPLLNVHDGHPIQGFPKTLGDFLALGDEEVFTCLEAFFTMTNVRKKRLTGQVQMQNRLMLATAIGINVSICAKLSQGLNNV